MSRWAVDGFLSSIKHGTRNLWDIYMVTTVEINTDRAVMVHQISTINEWIPICGYYEQHKKWLFKGLLIRKVKEAAAKSQGPFVPTLEPKYWRTRSTRFGQNFHRELVTAKGKGKKIQNEDGTHARSCTPNTHTLQGSDISFQAAL